MTRVRNLRAVASIIIGAFVIYAHFYGPVAHVVAQSSVPSPVQIMFDQHHCWTNDGHPHPTAHHTVIADSAGRPYYVGSKATDGFINRAVFGKNFRNNMTIVGFCR